jgi:FAD:protein FMN transferase
MKEVMSLRHRLPVPWRARRQWLHWALGGGAGALLSGCAPDPMSSARRSRPAVENGLYWQRRAMLAFGTTVWLQIGHEDAQLAQAGLADAIDAVRLVERLMSLYDPQSALSRLNREGVLADPPKPLYEVLRLAQHVARESSGAFDVTVQPLWSAWQSASAQGRSPSRKEREQALAVVGYPHLQVAPDRIELTRPGMAVTLNGIAQGYAADLVRARLVARGIGHAVLDTGEWLTLGASPLEPMRLGVADPAQSDRLLAMLRADGRALAVSDDAHTVFSADRRDHHILDPRTGSSPPQVSAVAVLAPQAALADALTKVAFMAGPDAVPVLARTWGVDLLVLDKSGRLKGSQGVPWA